MLKERRREGKLVVFTRRRVLRGTNPAVSGTAVGVGRGKGIDEGRGGSGCGLGSSPPNIADAGTFDFDDLLDLRLLEGVEAGDFKAVDVRNDLFKVTLAFVVSSVEVVDEALVLGFFALLVLTFSSSSLDG